MKHDMLQSEVQRSAQRMKPGDMEDHHKHEDLKNKVDNYGRKVRNLVEEILHFVSKRLRDDQIDSSFADLRRASCQLLAKEWPLNTGKLPREACIGSVVKKLTLPT